MRSGRETARRVRGGTFLREARRRLILGVCALGGFAICGLAALTLGGCGPAATPQGTPAASPTETPVTLFTPKPLGEHALTPREKRMLAAAADFVEHPQYQGYRTDPNDFRKYVGQLGEVVAYVVVVTSQGISVSVVVDTASGEVRPVATVRRGYDDPYFGVPQFTDGMMRLRPVGEGETWATEAARLWFYDQVVEKLDWLAAPSVMVIPEVAGYIVGWPGVGVLRVYATEQDGKPVAYGLGRYFPA
jgi:hypothetical protein